MQFLSSDAKVSPGVAAVAGESCAGEDVAESDDHLGEDGCRLLAHEAAAAGVHVWDKNWRVRGLAPRTREAMVRSSSYTWLTASESLNARRRWGFSSVLDA